MSAVSGTPSTASDHPVGLIFTDDLKRSRLTVFFRLLLAIPSFVFLALWGIAVYIAFIIAWFAALFTTRVPDGLHNFMAQYLRYTTHVVGYVYLLADPWPGFSASMAYPIDARIDGPQPQSRLTVFFRLVLAIPALILAGIFRQVNQIIAFLAWFYCLATGSMNRGMRDISAWLLRYELQTYAYIFLLTGRYPTLSGAPTP
jgi:hypothetical protein